MSSSRIEHWWAGRRVGALALLAVLLAGPAWASGPSSSPGDRERFVSVTRSLEQTPLDPSLEANRAWALAWLVEAPDVAVTVCADALKGLLDSKYSHAGAIVLQNSLSIGAFVIQHPEKANDPIAQQLAGMEGALAAYRSILRAAPEAKSSALEKLLLVQTRGELTGYVRKAWARCEKQGASEMSAP